MPRPIAVVTGANRGLGFEAAKGIAAAGFDIVLAVRSAERGRDAAARLRQAVPDAAFHVADGYEATDAKAVAAAAERIAADVGGRVDVLVNNAGEYVHPEDRKAHSPSELATRQIAISYTAPLAFTAALAPLAMRDGGRVVTVTGGLAYPAMVFPRAPEGSAAAALRDRWKAAESPAAVAALLNEYRTVVETDPEGRDAAAHGWPVANPYGIAKLALMACATSAPRHVGVFRTGAVTVNTMCPGFCKTDMTRGKGVRTPAQGADTMVWLATADDVAGVTGKHFSSRKQVDWRTAKW
eukprot:CAMPEP_0174833604 /NCGR_PEP_ID=MMETSP1114-20130205/4340_1 /TAXON_ID=312471 /ORGANISM="Neobodo designis, Strain CCAP 1951/1" /LENGTH=295 /DNA_ID=CAMNT_0016067495 /DNA_START=62 /DNA_END=949 /DNA_ORIENTATION=-